MDFVGVYQKSHHTEGEIPSDLMDRWHFSSLLSSSFNDILFCCCHIFSSLDTHHYSLVQHSYGELEARRSELQSSCDGLEQELDHCKRKIKSLERVCPCLREDR